MGMKEEKTNVMRALEQKKVPYKSYCYVDKELTNGVEIANYLGQDVSRVFKTLVTVGKSKEHYVFSIPVDMELDLKKAAKVAGVKAIEMLKVALLFDLTGYVRGGCTAVGMKKQFPVYINDTALNYDRICVSGGKIGLQIELSPDDLAKTVKARFTDLLM